ncbi:MAG: four helix bundle protein [Prevotella sp.]|nr:four helix bundle protein [Prevotella sp.]
MNDFYYRKLEVYHIARSLVVDVYRYCNTFPVNETRVLCAQLQRAAISVPSNIAEGLSRFSIRERIHFLEISYGSLMEVMCQIEISHSLNYINDGDLQMMDDKIARIARMLSGLRSSLEKKQSN